MSKEKLQEVIKTLDLALYGDPHKLIVIITDVAAIILKFSSGRVKEIDVYRAIAILGIHEILGQVLRAFKEFSPVR